MTRDVQSVRLCFQVTIQPDIQNRNSRRQLRSKVSQPITNKFAATNLRISEMSDNFSPASGGKRIFICCSAFSSNDIRIRFFEKNAENEEIWFDFCEFQRYNVGRNTSITTPRYRLENISTVHNVLIELVRPSDMERSDPLPFQYVPDKIIDWGMTRKEQKIDRSGILFDYLEKLSKSDFQGQQTK